MSYLIWWFLSGCDLIQSNNRPFSPYKDKIINRKMIATIFIAFNGIKGSASADIFSWSC